MIDLSTRSLMLAFMVMTSWMGGAMALWWIFQDIYSSWYWIPIALVYNLISAEFFAHQILMHRSLPVDTQAWTYKILVFFATVDLTYGNLGKNVVTHDLHHLYADQDHRDPIHAKHNWWTTGSLSPFMYVYQPPLDIPDIDQYFAEQQKKHQEIMQDKWTTFCGDHVIVLTIGYWSLLALVAPVLLFKVVFLGRLLISLMHLLVTLSTHTSQFVGSYKNFPESPAYNNLLLHYFLLGLVSSALHNNHHHGRQQMISHRVRWFEIDIGSVIINHVLKPLLIKR